MTCTAGKHTKHRMLMISGTAQNKTAALLASSHVL